MQLRESEALGIQDYHHRGVRHIHAYLYHGGGNENLGLSLHKLLHLCLFFGRFHPAVNLAQMELRKSLLQRLITFFQILQVHLLALLDQRENNIDLSAQINLPADALIETGELIVKLMQRLNRFSARRQLVYYAHVQIAIDGHRQRAGDRGGGHHQHMGRILALRPELGSLRHSKPVLLVDYRYAKAMESHRVFYHGMRAYQYLDIACSKSVEYLLPFLALDDAGEEFHPDVHALQEIADGLQMLLCEDFGRCHQTGLIAVVQSDEHSHQGYERLARAYVALKEPVHLSAAAHIGPDLVHHPFLGTREFERKMMGVETVEDVSDAVEDVAAVFASLVACVP